MQVCRPKCVVNLIMHRFLRQWRTNENFKSSIDAYLFLLLHLTCSVIDEEQRSRNYLHILGRPEAKLNGTDLFMCLLSREHVCILIPKKLETVFTKLSSDLACTSFFRLTFLKSCPRFYRIIRFRCNGATFTIPSYITRMVEAVVQPYKALFVQSNLCAGYHWVSNYLVLRSTCSLINSASKWWPRIFSPVFCIS